MVPSPSGPGLVMFFPSWRLSGLGNFVNWATSLFREAQAPALVRAECPMQRGPAKPREAETRPRGPRELTEPK